MQIESHTRAAVERRLFRITGLFLVFFAVWKLGVTRAIGGLLGDTSLLTYGLTEPVYALILVGVLWRTGFLRKAGFRAPVRARSALPGLPLLLLAGLLLAGAPALDTSPMVVLGFVVFALGSGLGEETILRGTLWEGLGGLGPWSRSITTAFAFGAVHLLGIASNVPLTVVLAQAVFAIGVGLVLAGVRLRAGSIWTVVFLHVVFNFGALWAGGGVSRTFASGAEAGLLVTGGVMALWGWAVIYWWVRASGAESKRDGSR